MGTHSSALFWHPGPTAPKDGRHILVPSQFAGFYIDEIMWDDKAPDGGGWWSVKIEVQVDPPEWWMPIPEEPPYAS